MYIQNLNLIKCITQFLLNLPFLNLRLYFTYSELRDELANCLESSMDKFYKIWADIGICESQQKQRSDTVILHLRNLLEEMVQEEESLRSQIRHRIDKYSKELKDLCQELSCPDYQVQ